MYRKQDNDTNYPQKRHTYHAKISILKSSFSDVDISYIQTHDNTHDKQGIINKRLLNFLLALILDHPTVPHLESVVRTCEEARCQGLTYCHFVGNFAILFY